MYENRKNDKSKIEWETKIVLFTLNHSIIDVWRWIFVQNIISQKEILFMKKYNKLWLNLNNLKQNHNDFWNKQSIKTLHKNNRCILKTYKWCCGYWDKCSCSIIWSHSGICNYSEPTNKNQWSNENPCLWC